MKKVLIIGSGFSSLSASCYLARAGFDVTVVEKNASPGGRAAQLKSGGFTFDMGPTWYWMPDIFEKFFADFDRKPSDFYDIVRLDPSYTIIGKDGFRMDVPANLNELSGLFEKLEKGSSSKLKNFLDVCAESYRIATGEMMYKPGKSALELVRKDTISNLNLFFQSMRSLVRKHFKHPLLQALLEFPILFLGAKPDATPAFYCFMNHADLQLGTWYPVKGFYSVVKGMVSLAEENGVKFLFNSEVKKIVVDGNRASGIIVNEEFIAADIVVSGADYHHTESLLPSILQSYSGKYWAGRTLAPSALLFFVGINKKLRNQRHHTLFFDKEFDIHARQIYDAPQWPADPLFYVSIPSVTDSSVAPNGQENITFLIPVASGLTDSGVMREGLFMQILERFEKYSGESIRENIVFKKSYCIDDFISDYNSFKGNAYGLANTLTQTAFLRPSIKSKKINNLYFAGQLTVPGPGVPPSLVSGKIVSAEVLKNYPVLT